MRLFHRRSIWDFDEQLNFNKQLESKINKCYKIIGSLKRLSNKLPRDALLRIYKFFVKFHLDSGDIVHDKPNNESFTRKSERVQCKAGLAVTRTIKGIFHKHIYKKLALESFSVRRWIRKHTFFYKMMKGNCPQYLSNYWKGNNNSVYNTKSVSQITLNTLRKGTEKSKN